MQTSYIVTFIGDDRPGLVEELSRTIENNGGSWQESRLAQLGGQFAGLVRISAPGENHATLQHDLSALSAGGLSVHLTPAGTPQAALDGRAVTLTVIGPDRPGIVREISRALAARGINVVEMDSAVVSAPMSAEMLFHARIQALVPPSTDMIALQVSLDEIANTMALEVDIESAAAAD